uniref:NAD-dependent succinate-semialdehyde dehydrogenase n=1 Tax=Altererythrobacter segetis TaxID=1104773 RepID=UPI0014084EF3|nr:NAD-dependent succinate-semialdehyde dehydrogenase [Altererythrobacter segetis]
MLELAEPRLLRKAAFIGGSWSGGLTEIDVHNPADAELIASVPDVGASGAMAAIDAAEDALPRWTLLTARERARLLRRWYDLITRHKEDLARLLTIEQGKPLSESRAEVDYAAAYIEWFSEEARRIDGDVLPPHVEGKRLFVFKKSVGIVAAITPWNFPLAMITRKVGPALAAGCTMVLKPSELTPLSALALAWLGEEAGLPAGVFNVVTGIAGPIGEVLTRDSRVRKFTFTGSTDVGKSLAAECMKTVKRVSLELGGNAPFIVFDDASLEAAVDGAIASKFRNAGQTCVCPNRLLIQAGIYDQFAATLADRVSRLRLGSGLERDTEIGPLIDDRAVAKAERHIADAIARGGRLLTGGSRPNRAGSFFLPTVIADVPKDALLCREETFAPVAGLVRFGTEAEAISLANATSSGLASYLFTSDASRIWRLSDVLESGMVGVNTGSISTEIAPFGGIKESGFGREGSRYGIGEYLNLKFICLDVRAETPVDACGPA